MKIVVDAMGGDFAPKVNVDGAIDALREYPDMDIILVGPQALVEETISAYGDAEALGRVRERLTVVDAPEVITTEEHPVMALRRKKNSTFVVGMDIVRRKEAQAFVSAGSTGALLSAATLLIKRIRGIRRAALAPVVPTANGKMVLIDCGATAEGTPEYLMQFAYMGSYYAQRFLGVENPRVALLNIGAEESKGLELQKQTYALLTEAKQAGRIHFVGNIEGREAITQGVDVLVTDGYTGNIFLKTMEGAAALFSGALKEMLLASTKNKVAALMLKNSIGDFKKRFDSSEVGGTALLGISQPVVKAHGSSNAYAFYNAIRQAKTVAEADIVGDIAANVEHMRWERPKPAEKQEEG